ncbi:hypothetical protein IBB3154_0949 [Ligilactobacillus salivarius]|uniref:hypothetical protein n=1 Tax=Ligilactobacillus salivarius TaxID=1624 RepID=UPI0013DDAF98|nr:hypothetical protein [Ligilactobacillus salivarius]QIG36158.1 hypothetical protein IBB3154_0667 [Ligilactobacillus salivarius]QIG36438.1 hypothetical protein IBB3154_0949 [Ligilactobacillus salivarius]
MNNAGSGFIILTVLVGIFLSGLSFGMGHLYIGFGFVAWVGLAMVALTEIRKDEEAREND